MYLFALVPPSTAWMNRASATQIALRYLVTTWADEEEEAHRLLGHLIMALLGKHEYELELTDLPASLWTAFGLVPRPAFMLRVPLYFEHSAPTPPLVRGPLVVRGAPAVSLHGTVLGPGKVPVAGARVELPALQLIAHTNTRGRFHFSTVPSEPRGIQLLVKARGCTQTALIEEPISDNNPLEICFDSFDAR
ncbi:hypothetical protein KDI_33320 [Dictyobacter arantiisoli]|uniref:Carboxypeptidase regulatory-like domain-containing protein n=1 Tax=Dictyobacter arantiisoli TaxID=2014874 RepID=A0A5A5TEV4_9CHLR|nr:hypothetical protein KDI_33320 [Dictyobacter arantiisoli]